MNDMSIKKNTLFSVVKSVMAIVFPLITFPYISRVLQPENVGKINFANSIVSYFALFASLGISTYATRECSKFKDNRNELSKVSSEIYSINIITTAVTYIALFISLMVVEKFADYRALILIQSLTILFATIGTDWINYAMGDLKYITIRTVLFQCISLVLMLLLVKSKADYFVYVCITVFASSAANIVNYFYKRRFCHIKFTFEIKLKKHIKSITALFAMLIAQQVFTMSDTTMIGFFYDDTQVGLYTTALKVYNIVNQIVVSITCVVLPEISSQINCHHYEEIRKILRYSLHFICFVGIPCVIGLFFLSNEVVLLIGGSSYVGATPVLRVLSLTLLASFAGTYVLNVNILSFGKDKIALVSCVVPALFNLITNYIFIPRFGIIAAAFTTVASQLLVVLICLPFMDWKCNTRDVIFSIWKILISSVLLIVTCIICTNMFDGLFLRMCSCIVAGGAIYIISLYILKEELLYGFINAIIRREVIK